jgi:hypothetical protein
MSPTTSLSESPNGGVIMVTFVPLFVSGQVARWAQDARYWPLAADRRIESTRLRRCANSPTADFHAS